MKGVWAWFFQRATGIILAAGLLVHFMVMHYSGTEQTSYHTIMDRLSNPYWKTFNLLFLISVVYHGFNGLWGIAIEYARSERLLKSLQALLLAAALLLIAAGVYILEL